MSPVCVAVHDRFGSSVRIEEKKEKDRWSVHRLPTYGTRMIMPHVILYGSASCYQSVELDDLPDHGPEGVAKRALIRRGQSAQFLEDKGWVDGCEDGFEDRWFEQSRPLPILHLHLTHGEGRGLPTGDCHDEEIGASLMVGRAADHDGRTAFDGGLIRKREGD